MMDREYSLSGVSSPIYRSLESKVSGISLARISMELLFGQTVSLLGISRLSTHLLTSSLKCEVLRRNF